jgi:glycosyltransferase involved in cell wall biosynthesis
VTGCVQINPCIIIPMYNNRDTIRTVVESVDYLHLPCLIIDDGSDEATQQALRAIDSEFDWVEIIRRPQNGGKGAAMRDGFTAATSRSYTHAIQIDADGQHNVDDIPRFLDEARRAPDALILSKPLFDADAPMSRRYGRLITTVCVWIETLSTEIRDTLCGFRCYPLAPVMRCYESARIGSGMVFDTEIAVHLYWQGTPVRNVTTKIIYTDGGLSHFDYVGDNLKISWMHTKLIAGMLLRFPKLVFRRWCR